MTSTRRLDGVQDPATTTAGRRSSAPTDGADFGSALAGALGAQAAESAHAGRSPAHVVKAGETLYGIASARLAASGQAVTPGVAMRHALQIARDNQIRNPDRIQTGQSLMLSPVGTSQASRAGGVSSASTSAGPTQAGEPHRMSASIELRALHDLDVIAEPIELDQLQTTLADTGCDAAECGSMLPKTPSSSPSVAQIARDDVPPLANPVPASRAAVELYERNAPAAADKSAAAIPDIVYKGMIGKALDSVPLDASTRTGLQQANAIVGNSFLGRSLAALTGIGGPVLTVAGLVWGIFSAQKIAAMQSGDDAKKVAQTTSPTFPTP